MFILESRVIIQQFKGMISRLESLHHGGIAHDDPVNVRQCLYSIQSYGWWSFFTSVIGYAILRVKILYRDVVLFLTLTEVLRVSNMKVHNTTFAAAKDSLDRAAVVGAHCVALNDSNL